jgi:hypothetical protein
MKCSTSHPLFGSMVNTEFNALVIMNSRAEKLGLIVIQVKAFDAECAKVGYQSPLPPPVPSKKRTYLQTTSTTSRGSSSKRGRPSR